jgi:hypothetical protein
MKRSIASLLPEKAMLTFAGRKWVTKGRWTIKYHYDKTDGFIRYCLYRGKGSGHPQYSTLNFDKAVEFTIVEPIYRHIVCLDGRKGGAYFYRSSRTMFDDTHPFCSVGFHLTDSHQAIVDWEIALKEHYATNVIGGIPID